MEANLRLKLEGDKATGEEGVYAVAALLQLMYVHLAEAYNEAVSAKQAAREDIALAVAERKLETMKATTNLLIISNLMLVKEGVKTMKKKGGDGSEMDCWNNKGRKERGTEQTKTIKK